MYRKLYSFHSNFKCIKLNINVRNSSNQCIDLFHSMNSEHITKYNIFFKMALLDIFLEFSNFFPKEFSTKFLCIITKTES